MIRSVTTIVWLTLLALVLLTSAALADEVTVGELAYGGSGCPAGTVSVEHPKQWAQFWLRDVYAVIRYDAFAVEAGGLLLIGRKHPD